MWQGKDPTAVAGEDKGKQSMGEKKARKIMGKLKEDARRLKRPWKEMEEEKNKEAAKMKRVREEVEKEMDREDMEAAEKNAKAMPNFPHFGFMDFWFWKEGATGRTLGSCLEGWWHLKDLGLGSWILYDF